MCVAISVEYPYRLHRADRSLPVLTVVNTSKVLPISAHLKAVKAKRTNLNAQEIGTRNALRNGSVIASEPAWDEATVNDMVREGLKAVDRHAMPGWRLGLVLRW